MWTTVLSYSATAIFSAAAAAFLAGLLAQNLLLVVFAFLVASAHAVLLGLPLAIAFRSRGWINVLTSTGAGFVIGALPVPLLAFLSPPEAASINGIPTVIDGSHTLAGLSSTAIFAAQFGLLGTIGGFVFWLVLKVSGRTSGYSVHPAPEARTSRRTGVIFSASLVALIGVFAIPSLVKDRSCHNPLRDGRASIGTELHGHIEIGAEDWPELIRIFEEFSLIREWSFRDDSTYGPQRRVLRLSMCTAAGTQISADQQIWPGDAGGIFE
jgi:hypothetical protein